MESAADRERLERALAECVEHFDELGFAVVERVAAGDVELARRLSERLEALARVGLLAAPRETPRRIGPYTIEATLGVGGMGAVYLARRDDAGDAPRHVALKVAHVPAGPSTSGDPEREQRLRARFERELRAASALDHPGFVRIFEFGESDGRQWFAMERLAGTTLADLLDALRASGRAFADVDPVFVKSLLAARTADVPLAATIEWGRTFVETACRWVLALAEALAHAHAHGVIHRDVKPANVMIGPDAAPKLFDLGLARIADDPALTRSGEFAGSPYYVAPEQLAGRPSELDERCDVYALGVTLFELLTWRRPFEGANTAQVFRAIQTKEAPLVSRLNPLVPRDLETIVSVALEKDRERRYRSMDEFAADLRRFLSFQPVLARPLSPARRLARWVRRNPARAAASGLAATVAIGLPLGLFVANRAIRDEQARTEREARVKAKAIDELVQQFALAEDERAAGATITARELLDRGAERSFTTFANEPELQAALFEATGSAYANLGLLDRAIPLLDRALALRESLGATDPAELARLLERLAFAQLGRGDAATANLLAERGLAALAASGAAESAAAARLEGALAEACELGGDPEAARGHFERALDLAGRVHGPDSEELGRVLLRAGTAAAAHGELELARERLQRALVLLRAAWSPDAAAIVRAERELATVLELEGESALAAEALLRARSLAGAAGDAERFVGDVRFPFDVSPDEAERYGQAFQTGVTALQARQLELAIERFEACLELRPGHPVPAYNLACAHALGGELERAFECLDQALDWGFGTRADRLRTLETDADLAALRADPRFDARLARARTSASATAEFAARDVVYVPARSHRRASSVTSDLGLVVLLHDSGSTPDAVLDEAWRRRADELGCAVLAPCGTLALSAEPTHGMAWLVDPHDLVRRPELGEGRVAAAVKRFSDAHAFDRSRVWIVGVGQGALIAFDVATRAPGLFRGVLAIDGPLHPETPPERVRRAASMGLAVHVVLATPSTQWRSSCALAEVERRLGESFASFGFGERAHVDVSADADAHASAVGRAIERLCR